MPRYLKKVLADGAYTPEELAEIEQAYLAVCAELGIASDNAAWRTVVAFAVLEQAHKGNVDHVTIIEAVKQRLAPMRGDDG